jgi:hypothetical protein
MEIWRDIDNYDNYQVSNFGNVRNSKKNNLMTGSSNNEGYYVVSLSKDGIAKKHRIHRLVASAFLDNPDDKELVDHIDGNKANNHFGNLRWASSTENNRNRNISIVNTSGTKGVSWNIQNNKWQANVTIDGIQIFLGYYDSIDDAKQARVTKVNANFGNFIHAIEKIH